MSELEIKKPEVSGHEVPKSEEEKIVHQIQALLRNLMATPKGEAMIIKEIRALTYIARDVAKGRLSEKIFEIINAMTKKDPAQNSVNKG